MGGYLTHHLGWRSVFLINVPLGLLAVLLTMRLKSRAYREQPWRFDTLGLLLFITFIVPFLLALDQAQRMQRQSAAANRRPGRHFAARPHRAHQTTAARGPSAAADHALAQSDASGGATPLAACHGATLVSLITFLPLYLRVLRGPRLPRWG